MCSEASVLILHAVKNVRYVHRGMFYEHKKVQAGLISHDFILHDFSLTRLFEFA